MMSSIAIKFENLGKKYLIRYEKQESRKTFQDLLIGSGKKVITSSNLFDRSSQQGIVVNESMILKNINRAQEETPNFDRQVFTMRDFGEEIEAVEAFIVMLAGTDKRKTTNKVQEIINNKRKYEKTNKAFNFQGDGKVFKKIVEFPIEI